MMRTISLVASMLFSQTLFAEIVLSLPAVCDSVWENKTLRQQNAANIMSESYKAAGISTGRCLGWTNLNSGDLWYEVSRDLKVYGVNVETKQYLGNWPLSPWPQTVRMIGEGMSYIARPEIAAVEGGEYSPINDPNLMILDSDFTYALHTSSPSLGCLNQSPLRYGDIDGDAQNELVLFLNDDLVVFSPEWQKIVFSSRLTTQDEMSASERKNAFPDEKETDPQYISFMGTAGKSRTSRYPAIRSFSKIYINDFNNDNKADIVVWRKLYESRLKSDPVIGFQKVADLFIHYQLEGGEYQLQTANPAVNGVFEWDQNQQDEIKSWLTSNNLTWQKGFPSKSECAGQEGQLIPEMHDLLLNDPDVLE